MFHWDFFPLRLMQVNDNNLPISAVECFGNNKVACVWTTNTLTTKLVWTAVWFMKCFLLAFRARRQISNNLSSHHWRYSLHDSYLSSDPCSILGFTLCVFHWWNERIFLKAVWTLDTLNLITFTDSVLLGLTGTALTWLSKTGLFSGRKLFAKSRLHNIIKGKGVQRSAASSQRSFQSIFNSLLHSRSPTFLFRWIFY